MKKKLAEAVSQLRSLHSTYRVGQRVALCYVIPDLNQKSRYANASKVRSFFKQVPEQLEDAQTFVASFWYEKKHRATKKGSTPALCS